MSDELMPHANNDGNLPLNAESLSGDTSSAENNAALSSADYNNAQESTSPVTAESLAEKNKDLGEEAVRIASHQEELDKASPLNAANPNYWMKRHFWKEQKTRNNRSQESLRQEAEKYIGELQEEANNIAAAYSEYEKTQNLLASEIRGEPVLQSMDQFIRELDDFTGARTSRYDGDERQPIGEERYREAGKFLAVADYFTPHLPLAGQKVPTSYLYDYPSALGPRTFETFGAGHRMPRLDLATDKEMAKLLATQKETDKFLEVNIRTSTDGSVSRPAATRLYIPLPEQSLNLVQNALPMLQGVIGLGSDSNEVTFRAPWAFIDFSASIKSLDELNEPQAKIILSYETSDGNYHNSELYGPENELREQAFAELSGQDWASENGLSSVSNAKVQLGDGEVVSWYEYTEPLFDTNKESGKT